MRQNVQEDDPDPASRLQSWDQNIATGDRLISFRKQKEREKLEENEETNEIKERTNFLKGQVDKWEKVDEPNEDTDEQTNKRTKERMIKMKLRKKYYYRSGPRCSLFVLMLL